MSYDELDCPRKRSDCQPLSNIVSDEEPKSFICVGVNDGTDRMVEGDCYTYCWKNDVIDDRSHWDKRDLIDTMSVIAGALSIEGQMDAEQAAGETKDR